MAWFAGALVEQEVFLKQYFRKQAVHLCHGLPLAMLPKTLSPALLYRLCLDELVESRLIDQEQDIFKLAFGPFELENLKSTQMLMIQSLESHLELISDFLIQHFSFMPRWRIDDVMATYANKDASCGAHFDHYDVFLIQIRGEKLWHLDDGGHHDDDLSQNTDIRLLNQFEATSTITQRPGDILYIPPGVGHWGIASDDCLTLSVGMRNPTLQEMISHYADMVGDSLDTVQTMDDSLNMQETLIPLTTTDSISKRFNQVLNNPALNRQWFGAYMTELREPDLISAPTHVTKIEQISALLKQSGQFKCHLATRIALQVHADTILLFVNGNMINANIRCIDWLLTLEKNREINTNDIPAEVDNLQILVVLINCGAISAAKSHFH